MKTPVANFAAAVPTPVFPPTLHTLRPDPDRLAKVAKRDNVFSKSRDTREDRGLRKIKTSHTNQTIHAR